jgi:hypothetical protein
MDFPNLAPEASSPQMSLMGIRSKSPKLADPIAVGDQQTVTELVRAPVRLQEGRGVRSRAAGKCAPATASSAPSNPAARIAASTEADLDRWLDRPVTATTLDVVLSG